VTLVSEETISREYYGIMGDDSFVYNIDLSTDGGETLNTVNRPGFAGDLLC
jgi:hypothetical protein